MEGAAGGGFGGLHGTFREKMREFGDLAGAAEGLLYVVALKVNVWIDFVSDGGTLGAALIVFEADVVSGGADPEGFAIDGEGGFPEAQVIARSDHLDGFGVGPAVVLDAAEEIELAHGHG